MAKVSFVCNRYPFLKIGKQVWFQDGLFTTEDPELQKMIEANSSFGIHIHYQDPPVTAKAKAQKLEDGKMQGGYKSDKAQNATRKVAGKIGLDPEESEELVRAREAAVVQVQAAISQRKRGRPRKIKEEEQGYAL